MQYCKKQSIQQVCLDYCLYDQHCGFYDSSEGTAAAICSNECNSILTTLYHNTPEYAEEKAEAERRAKQHEKELAIRAADAKLAQEKREKELAQQRKEDADRTALENKIAEEQQRFEEEQQRIKEEDRVAKLKAEVLSLSSNIKDELITTIPIAFGTTNVSLDQCTWFCASVNFDGPGIHVKQLAIGEKIVELLNLTNSINNLPKNIYPYKLRGTCKIMTSEQTAKLNQLRAAEDNRVIVCDALCPDVINRLPKKRSLKSILSGQ